MAGRRVLEGSGSGGGCGVAGAEILEGPEIWRGSGAGLARASRRRPAKWEATSSGARRDSCGRGSARKSEIQRRPAKLPCRRPNYSGRVATIIKFKRLLGYPDGFFYEEDIHMG